jgi:phage terminase small subunit
VKRSYEVFITEYLRTFNKTEAAKAAGYSEKTAGQQGYRLFNDAQIKAEIDRRYQEMIGPKEKIVHDVLTTLTDILATGEKDSDRVAAAKVLAQHAGMLTDKVELSGKDGEAIVFQVVKSGDKDGKDID